ncbi:MAG: amidase family protein [Acidimicrobiales bacterium]
MNLEEYASYDATGLAELVDRREVRVDELAACAIAGTQAVNETLNAVVEAFADRAESLAAGAEPAVAGGPFAGVPTMLKDLFHGEAGIKCENGSRLSAGWVQQSDSAFAQRIRASGLVNLGRTTTSEFGIMGTTETLAAGPTCTPWSASHMAGGSSGGSASAVGAGIVPVASASDGGGSIRIPASACGVVGLKPSRGRITWGPYAGEALAGWAVHFMVSRTVRDCAGLLDCLAGPTPGDPFVIAPPPRPFASEIGAPTGSLRIGWRADPWSGDEPDAEVVAAAAATAGLLGDLGHAVSEAQLAVSWEPFLQAMTDVWAADLAHMIDGFAPVLGRVPGHENLEGTTLSALEYGRRVSAADLFHAADRVNLLARVMGAFFGEHDVLLTPTLGRLPAPLGLYDPTARMELHEVFATWSPWESFLPVFNAAGLPAITLPLHESRGGLPIGMQLVGPFGSESLLLRLAAQLEEALPWAGRRPPIHVASAG